MASVCEMNDPLTSQIVNKASWERGFAHGSVYKSEFIDLSEKIKQGDDSNNSCELFYNRRSC